MAIKLLYNPKTPTQRLFIFKYLGIKNNRVYVDTIIPVLSNPALKRGDIIDVESTVNTNGITVPKRINGAIRKHDGTIVNVILIKLIEPVIKNGIRFQYTSYNPLAGWQIIDIDKNFSGVDGTVNKLPLNIKDFNLLDYKKFPKLPILIKLTEDVEGTDNQNKKVIVKKDSIFKVYQTQNNDSLFNEETKVWIPYNKVAGKAEIVPETILNALKEGATDLLKTVGGDLKKDILSGVNKVRLGVAVAGWGALGIMIYKKLWAKSTGWKIVIGLVGAGNIYNTFQYFSTKKSIESTTSGLEKKADAQTTTGNIQDRLNKAIESFLSLLPKDKIISKKGMSFDNAVIAMKKEITTQFSKLKNENEKNYLIESLEQTSPIFAKLFKLDKKDPKSVEKGFAIMGEMQVIIENLTKKYNISESRATELSDIIFKN